MIGQILAERYEIKEIKDAGRTFVAEDKYRPGYPLCLIQRIQGQGSSVQTRTMAKLMLEQRVEAIAPIPGADTIDPPFFATTVQSITRALT